MDFKGMKKKGGDHIFPQFVKGNVLVLVERLFLKEKKKNYQANSVSPGSQASAVLGRHNQYLQKSSWLQRLYFVNPD